MLPPSAASAAARLPLRAACASDVYAMVDACTDKSPTTRPELFHEVREALDGLVEPHELYLVVRRMRKKLKSKQHACVMSVLLLFELLMNELGSDFHLAVATHRKLPLQMNQVIKAGATPLAAGAKPVGGERQARADKCLELVAQWGERFRTKIAIGRPFVEWLAALKTKWRFPDPEPVAARPALAAAASPAQQLAVVDNVTSMLAELIVGAGSREAVRSDEIILQLAEQCRGFQVEIATLLSSAEERELPGLLGLNEKIVDVLALHASALANGPPRPPGLPALAVPPPTSAPSSASGPDSGYRSPANSFDLNAVHVDLGPVALGAAEAAEARRVSIDSSAYSTGSVSDDSADNIAPDGAEPGTGDSDHHYVGPASPPYHFAATGPRTPVKYVPPLAPAPAPSSPFAAAPGWGATPTYERGHWGAQQQQQQLQQQQLQEQQPAGAPFQQQYSQQQLLPTASPHTKRSTNPFDDIEM
jgi:hypothetical protein